MVHVLTAEAGTSLHDLALAGDEGAFETLMAPLVDSALRLAYSMLGDRTEAEDATQEAITRAWRKLGQFRADMPLRPWFLAIVVNQCRNVRRTRWFRFVRTTDTYLAARDSEPGVERVDIARALARVREADREALFLHFYLDLPIGEVVIALGISAAAAKGRIYRACHRLRPDLAEEDF